MSSSEIAKKRKELEIKYQDKINITTGELTNAREDYLKELEKLQKKCKHIWDNGEIATIKIEKVMFCSICRKKII